MNQATRPPLSKVTTIDPEQDIVTLINTFTLRPENQEPFLKAQSSEYKRLTGKIAGSLVANLHRGKSGSKAVNYAQFRTLAEFRSWQQGDLMKEHMPFIQPYVERAEPGLYRVVEVVARDGRTARIEESETSVALIATVRAEPEALGEIVVAQRAAARRLVEELPGLRSMAIHQGIPSDRPLPNAALYAQLDSDEAARALLEHPAYRACFTTEHPRIHASEAELYAVALVQPATAL